MSLLVPETPHSPRLPAPRLDGGPVVWLAVLALFGAVGVAALVAGPVAGAAFEVFVTTLLYLCAATGAVIGMWRTYPHTRIGMCNIVTLVRLILTAALVAPLVGADPSAWAVFALASVALSLDAVDGWFARRQGLTSGFGARFDMEVDAALGLILAANALAAGVAGPLVLVLGMPRYVFAAGGLMLPWLSRPLPERFGRKLACVIQIAVLVALQPAILPPAVASGAIVLAALALAWSFGRDILWLWQNRQ